MSAKTERVDVNAVLAKHHGRLAFGPHPQEADEMADVRRAVAELIGAARMLIAAESPKQCFQNRKEADARKLIRSTLARIGGGV